MGSLNAISEPTIGGGVDGQAIGADPSNVAAYCNRGTVLKDMKQLDAALESYNRALGINPKLAEAYFNRGLVLADLKQSGAAVASYDRAIAIKPDHSLAYNNRGNALRELKQFDAALASYDQAIATDSPTVAPIVTTAPRMWRPRKPIPI